MDPVGNLNGQTVFVPVINGKLSWEKEHCLVLAGMVLAIGKTLGHSIRWGGNWDMDGEPITDQDFQDLVHFEYRGISPQ